jgi:thiol-disulfide isomerase/thioredoxin
MLKFFKQLFFLVALWPCSSWSQHSIKGKFLPADEYKMALLYRIEPTHYSYVTNAPIASNGNFELKLDSTVAKGIFRITYAVPQEEYNFDVIYDGTEDVELNFNAETGVKFLSSRENKLLESYTNSMMMITNSIGNYYKEKAKVKSKTKRKAKDTLDLAAIFKIQQETQKEYEKAAKGTIVSHFIKANMPYTPKSAVDLKTYISEVKAHFFDHIDFNNTTLQSSKFLSERMSNYVFGISSNNADDIQTYKQNIDVFYKAMAKATPEVKKTLLTDLWEQMVDLKIDVVANYIAEAYLMELCVNANDQKLLQALLSYQRVAIGALAPDFSIQTSEKAKKESQKLSTLQGSKHYVIVFWSSACSHCLKEIPQLHTFSKTLNEKQLKVIAVGLEDEPYAWKNLTYDFSNFIHVYGKGKWDNEIGNAYDVSATPTYFILNSDKEIVSKPDGLEDLETFFKVN